MKQMNFIDIEVIDHAEFESIIFYNLSRQDFIKTE